MATAASRACSRVSASVSSTWPRCRPPSLTGSNCASSTRADESPSDQYHGDFWGLYLAIENEDGHFLKAHRLPSGNLYKMEFGGGQLRHQGAGAVTNGSDLNEFRTTCRQNQSEAWWRANFELTNYYSYRAICECIHHYDTGEGKNYDYYHNPATGRWQFLPWDIDLTWADNMYGNGEDPFKEKILSHPHFRIEYQNRLREIRDLLFNPEQTGNLIDEYASVIWDSAGTPSIVEADRRKWDYHPAMAAGGKAGQGLFYQASSSRDFRGMARLMKDYVRSRGAWIELRTAERFRCPGDACRRLRRPHQFSRQPASVPCFGI